MSPLRFSETTVDEILAIPFIDEVFDIHWLDVYGTHRTGQPTIDRYRALEQTGALVLILAHSDDGIIGYSFNILIAHMHTGILTGMNDLLFLGKEYRRGRTGIDLIKHTEQKVKARGAEQMIWGAQVGSTLSYLLQRLRYQTTDVFYKRKL